jgi:predicted O-methyltransferase YrrM
MREITPLPRIQYIRQLFAREDDLLSRMRHDLEEQEFPIQIGSEEGKLLQLLIKLSRTKSIMEVGTHAGYSTLWMARALPEDGSIITVENSPSRAARARANFAECDVRDKISLMEGEAVDVLKTIDQSFDMIFIDADKINYLNYLDWAEEHINQGGLIIGDNTFLFENVYQDQPDKSVRPATHAAMKEFNRRLADPVKYCSIMLPTKEGMTIAMKI